MEYGHGGDIYTHEGMTDYSINVNPFGPGTAVIEAVCGAAAQIGQYPDSRCTKLRNALAEHLKIPAELLLFGNGAAELMFSLVLAQKPQKAILAVPSFAEYEQALKAAGCEIQYYYLQAEEGFCLNENYLDMLTKDVDIIFLCCPNNPTGQVIDKELLRKILDRCEEKQIRMVLDECFCEFLEHPEDTVMLPEAVTYRQLFLLRAFTKIYAMPGLRLGYAVSGDERLREQIERVRQPWNVSVLAQSAGIAALKDQERVAAAREYVAAERKWLEQELDRIGIRHFPSKANYILLKSNLDLYALLKEQKFLIRDCSNYKGLEKGYYRIAVRLREDNVRLLQAIAGIKEEIPDGKVNYDSGNHVKCW